jgi:hypothetical protein
LIIFRGCCDTPAGVVARLSQNAEGVATTSAFFHGKSWKLTKVAVSLHRQKDRTTVPRQTTEQTIVLTIKKLRKEKSYGKDTSFNED